MTEKVFGYVLIVLGVLFILGSAYSVYAVFTNRADPIQFFSVGGISLDPTQLLGGLPPELTQVMKEGGQQSKTEIIPEALINKNLNAFAHLVLMGFMGGVGLKLATIGAMLVRPIVVKVKENEGVSKN